MPPIFDGLEVVNSVYMTAAATEPGPMSDKVAPLVVGALMTLLVTLVVQVIVVPWIEARKRQAQRWEEDVRALGELLTFDLPRTVHTASRELHYSVILKKNAPKEGTEPERAQRLENLRIENQRKLRAVDEELASTNLRLDWLQERVGSLTLHNALMYDFRHQGMLLYVNATMFEVLHWKADDRYSDSLLTEDEINEARASLDRSVQLVLKLVKRFGTSTPPRNSLRLSLTHQSRRLFTIARTGFRAAWSWTRRRQAIPAGPEGDS